MRNIIVVNRPLFILLSIVLLLLVGFAGMQLQALLFPSIAEEVRADSTCDLHKTACSATFSDGAKVTFSITPRPISPLAELTYDVNVQGMAADAAIVDIQGETMNMGLYHTPLKPKVSGQFTAKGGVPVCTTQRMVWRADVRLSSNGDHRQATFNFVVER